MTNHERENEQTGWRNGCSSGKLAYRSRRGAKLSANRFRQEGGDRLRPYECLECHCWHLGHLPRNVIRGSITRGEIYRP